MTATEISKLLIQEFPHEITSDQNELIQKLGIFFSVHDENKTFLLKGYAGTGKTTIISTLVRVLPRLKKKVVLMAPTGRAAKVMTKYSGLQSLTIHKSIYFNNDLSEGKGMMLRENKYKNAVFIVDEASMISAASAQRNGLFPETNILDDLLTFVFSGENASLILVGDTAQLPPVGSTLSPALNVSFLKSSYHLSLDTYELTQVVRQAEGSGILKNATTLRKMLANKTYKDFVFDTDFKDISSITGMELEDELNAAYSANGDTETIVICRSNKRANLFNQQIRHRIFYREGVLNAGDKIMVVKNNYRWLQPGKGTGFIANGDIAEVMHIRKFETLFDHFQFADATIRLIDYPEEKDFEAKILLNTLTTDTPALSVDESKMLYQLILEGYGEFKNPFEKFKALRQDPYLNALQIKFAYALTCHKTQGGQWEQVFVEQGYLTDEMMNEDFVRWLYTAVTRGISKVHLLNFNEKFF